MSNQSTQKLLVAMTCAFGVTLVLVGYGRQKSREFDRSMYKSNSIASGRSVESTPLHEQATTAPGRTNFASAKPLPKPEPSLVKQGVVENYFDSSPLGSAVPSQRKTQHPIARQYAQSRQKIHEKHSPTVSTNVWATQPANFGNVQQAVASSPILGQEYERQVNVAPQAPQPDNWTAPKHTVRNGASHLSTQRGMQRRPVRQFTAINDIAKPIPQQHASGVRRADFEMETSNSTSSPIRIDKRVRKANWADIEISPTNALKPTYHPRQQAALPQRRTAPHVEAKAREQLRYGQSLARRRSFFAAREEFVRTLLLIANSYNTEVSSSAYTDRLTQALIALDEASDFLHFPHDSNSARLQQKILSHKSRLLTIEAIETITPVKAIGLYSNFAQSQLEQAIGASPVGSEALHALGKLESIAPETDISRSRNNQTKTLIFYQAAFNINPSNSNCANDLGVLLYNMGRLQESEHALKAALGTKQSQMSWNNLALVHHQLATTASTDDERIRQSSLAHSAAQQAKLLSNQPANDSPSGDQWATLAEFQNNAAFPNIATQNTADRPTERTPPQGVSRSAKLKQKMKEWF